MGNLWMTVRRVWIRPVFSTVAGALAVLFLSSCMLMNYPGGLSGSSTPLEGKKYTVLGDVQEETCVYSVMGFAMGVQRTPKEIIDESAKSKGGDALIDVTLRSRVFMWMLLIPVVQACSIVEGKAIKVTN
jgi:hypothetical protein